MKHTRFASLLLAAAVVLTALTLPASAADGGPVLNVTGWGTSTQSLSLTDLPADCYGIQLSLELDRELENVSVLFADSLPTAGSYCTYQEGVPDKLDITLYLTAKAAFPQGELALGILSGNESFQIRKAFGLKLLLGSELRETLYETVTVKQADTGSTGSPGSSGGSGGSGGSGESRYEIRVPSTANGTLTLSTASAAAGSLVTVTARPNQGYQLSELTASLRGGGKVALTDKGGGVFTFVMPGGAVELQAVFVPLAETLMPFTDVKDGSWYYDAVEYAYTHGLMVGTSETSFSPDAATSRGMIVSILYRLEGEPGAGEGVFRDVPSGQWYTDAVNWAAANGIVSGYGDGSFGPGDAITREQMASILYRYADYRGWSVSGKADLSAFPDETQVSPYAVEAVKWAVEEGLIQGAASGNSILLSPSGSAARSQSAAILMRFCESIAQ